MISSAHVNGCPPPDQEEGERGVLHPLPGGLSKNILHGRCGVMRFAFFALLADLVLWVVIYLGISYFTGSYNLIKLNAVAVPILVLMSALSLIGSYRIRTDFASLRYASEHLIACILAYPLAAFIQYVITSYGSGVLSSRAIYTASFFIFCGLSLLVRRWFWFASSEIRSQEGLLVIVDEEYGSIFYRDYLRSEQHQKLLFLTTSPSMIGKRIAGGDSPVIEGEASQLGSVFRSNEAIDFQGIVIASKISHLDAELMSLLSLVHFKNMPVYTLELFYEQFWDRVLLRLIGPRWPFEVNFVLVQNSIYSTVKRFWDFFIALFALLLLSPLFLLIALAIRIVDGAPIFYSQLRIGIYQHPFILHKFRTMRVGSDQQDRYTREGDSRVTRIGSFLRKTRLDELPQLWNVLLGDMSMIGPRAEWVKLVADYEKEIPHYHFRHLVKPGITGWAQVNYPYGASLEDTLEKLSYDLHYIRNFSMRLDAEVVLKTLYVIFFGKGQ
jgi:exopolysaccharide biosynthesis polyprenyl glycosylphosphotransferase